MTIQHFKLACAEIFNRAVLKVDLVISTISFIRVNLAKYGKIREKSGPKQASFITYFTNQRQIQIIVFDY